MQQTYKVKITSNMMTYAMKNSVVASAANDNHKHHLESREQNTYNANFMFQQEKTFLAVEFLINNAFDQKSYDKFNPSLNNLCYRDTEHKMS